MKTISKHFAHLANKFNEESEIEPLQLIEPTLNNKNLDLTQIVNDVPEFTDDSDALLKLKNYCQDIASFSHIYDDQGNMYEATLFVVPLLFHKPKKQKVKNIDKNNLLYGDLVKSVRKSGLVPEESNVFIHHYLYHPNELVEASYNDINNIFKSMLSFTVNKGKK